MFNEKLKCKIQLLFRKVVLFILLALMYLNGTFSSSAGYIVPRSVSAIEGSNVTFECSFNSSLCSSKCFDKLKCNGTVSSGIIVDNICIHFGYNNRTPISKEYIAVINSSAVALNLINTQPTNEIIKCHCNDCFIDGSDIYVEKHLEPRTDFGCSSHDFSYMDCAFSTSEDLECNIYSLKYSMDVFDSSTTKACNLTYNKDEKKCFCKIEGSDYYQFIPYYLFKLEAIDKIQQQIQKFTINQIEIMKTAEPEFKLINKTSNSLKLEWEYKNAKYFRNFKKSISFYVEYYPRLEFKETDKNSLTNAALEEIDNLTNTKYTIELKDLHYAYTNYTIEITSHFKSEINNPTLESKQKLVLETESKAPETGPKILPGIFYIDENNNTIRLYWQPLQKFEENGKNVTYIIKDVFINDQYILNWRPEKLNINSALYTGYDIKNKYEFHIYSENEVGISRKYSSIKVPKRIGIEKNYSPLFVGKISNKLNNNRNIFEIIWTPPLNNSELDNYTIFWCKATDEMSPNICESTKYNSINFTEIQKSENSYSVTIDNIHEIYNLGVSANYKNFSSGIVWAPCTANKNVDFKEVDILPQSISGKNYITINWNLQCNYKPLVQNYDLKYCHGIISKDTDCEIIKINKNMTSSITSFQSYTINNLQPNQKYLINIRMSSELKAGPYLKDLLVYYTQEDAPSPPRNLKVFNVTNKSAKIEWDLPLNPNGIIKSYEILLYDSISNNSIKNITVNVNQTNQMNNSIYQNIQYKIVDLKSYNSYKVFVIAKTIYPSYLSNGVEFKTSEGYPSTMQRGNLKKNNEKTIISWNSPIDKGIDNITFYQVIVRTEKVSQISIVSQEFCTLRYSCIDFDKNSQFIINAVSINAIPRKKFIGDNGTFLVIPQCEKSYSHDKNDGKFLCEENIHAGFFTEEYCNSKIFLASNESVIYDYFDCGDISFSIILLIIVVITTILIFLGVFSACYFGLKKLNAMRDLNLTYPHALYDGDSIISERQNENYKKKTAASVVRDKLNLCSNNFLNFKRNIKIFGGNKRNRDGLEYTVNRNTKSNIHFDRDAVKLLNEQKQKEYLTMTPITSTDHCNIDSHTEVKMLPNLNEEMEKQKKISKENLNENINENETEFNNQCQFGNITKNSQNKSENILNSLPEVINNLPEQQNFGYVKPNQFANIIFNRQVGSINQSRDIFPSGYIRPTNRKLLQNISGYVHPNWKNFMQTMTTYNAIDPSTSSYIHTNQLNDIKLNNTDVIEPCQIYNLNSTFDETTSGYVHPIRKDFLQHQNFSFEPNTSGYIRSFRKEFQQPKNLPLDQVESGFVHPKLNNHTSFDIPLSRYVSSLRDEIQPAYGQNGSPLDYLSSRYVDPTLNNFLKLKNSSATSDIPSSGYVQSFRKEFQLPHSLPGFVQLEKELLQEKKTNPPVHQTASGYIHPNMKDILQKKNSSSLVDQNSESLNLNLLLDQNISGYVLPGNLNINLSKSNKIIDITQDEKKFLSAYVKPNQLEKCKTLTNQSETKSEKLLKECDEYNFHVVPEAGDVMEKNMDDSILGYVPVNCTEFKKKMKQPPDFLPVI